MTLVTTIEAAVNQAFLAAKDLVKKGILLEEKTSGFNFASGTIDSEEELYSVEFLEKSSVLEQDNNLKKEIIIREKDLETSRYSLISFEDKTFRLEKIEEYPGIKLVTIRSV